MNNQLTLVGYVGQNPRTKVFADTNNKVVKFSVGVKEFSGGEETTLWVDVDAWNGLGDRVLQTITKGREVVLTGRLGINHIPAKEDNGNCEQFKAVLKLSSFHLCGPKPKAAEEETPQVSEATESSDSTKKQSTRARARRAS